MGMPASAGVRRSWSRSRLRASSGLRSPRPASSTGTPLPAVFELVGRQPVRRAVGVGHHEDPVDAQCRLRQQQAAQHRRVELRPGDAQDDRVTGLQVQDAQRVDAGVHAHDERQTARGHR